ncbi:DUF4233 domain-containing protein [Fodinicola feengrottensis]|uniref:DUF4233 domain-containing protein n=1 Tax=Fodinicola feengrottensis TaxID=435914 RepID=A0ABP4U737_9ACTN|nr:DUF4233 domain-containing protein [Fodinicola feengrottensis]
MTETPEEEEPTSGLRNPQAAARGVGSATLLLEALVLLLALVPLTKLSGHVSGLEIGVLLGLIAVCVLTCAVLKRSWGWHLGTAIQVAIILTGFFNWALLVLGLVFLAIWAYVLHVRRTVLRPAHFDH